MSAKSNPISPELNHRLQEAISSHQAGKLTQAKEGYEAVLAVAPNEVSALQLLGLVEKRLGNVQKAMALMQRSLQLNDQQPAVWFNVANTFSELKNYEAAYEAYKQALRSRPDDVDMLYNFGSMCRHVFCWEEGIDALKKVIAQKPNHADAWRNLGVLYKAYGKNEQALEAYEQCLRYDPKNPLIYVNMGNAHKSIGKLQQAMEAYEQALAIEPKLLEAHRFLAQVKSYCSSGDFHIQQMEQLKQHVEALPEVQRAHLQFALSDAYFKAKAYEEAMESLNKANSLKRTEYTYSTQAMGGWFAHIMDVFDAKRMQEGLEWQSGEEKPIFIVGMPRSGTSLVEQVLASHSDVHGAGELDAMRYLLQTDWKNKTGGNFPSAIDTLFASHAQDLAKKYLEVLQRVSPHGVRFVTDKMPGNFRFLGIIHMLFPKARIIHCKRDAMDTCFSIYRQCFTGAHPYAYEQKELGEYYRLYEQMMTHWKQVLPKGTMLDVRYEEMVEDQEAVTRKLLEFCDLPWEAACLDFHKTKRAVNTASATQVRQPIYKNAMRSWEPCAETLIPLRKILEK